MTLPRNRPFWTSTQKRWGCDVPDPALHGNGYACPACELRREEAHGIGGRLDIPCNQCGGTGRIARPILEIIAEHVAEARQHYWKEKKA